MWTNRALQRLRLRRFLPLKYTQNTNYIGCFTKTISPQTMKHTNSENSKIKEIAANNRKRDQPEFHYPSSLKPQLTFGMHLHPVLFGAYMLSLHRAYKYETKITLHVQLCTLLF